MRKEARTLTSVHGEEKGGEATGDSCQVKGCHMYSYFRGTKGWK